MLVGGVVGGVVFFCLWLRWLIVLISRKIVKVMIRNWISVLMNML